MVAPSPFNPFGYAYTGAERFLALLDQEPVGHKILNSGVPNQYGVVHSHPAISMFHEAGDSEELGAWAEVDNLLVYANGGRPVRVQGTDARWGGVLPPTTRPTIALERTPLYEENEDNATGGPDDDPVDAATGAGATLYHLRNRGNNYIEIPYHAEMAWDTAEDFMAFKAWVYFDSVDGRQLIFSNKLGTSVASGGLFFDNVDGVARVGWYDTAQAREVWVETSGPVFMPGHWHYVHVRKRRPDPTYTAAFANWEPNGHNLPIGAAHAGDVCIVRVLPKAAPVAPFADLPNWFSKGALTAIATKMGRISVSFMTRRTAPAGTTATGFVSQQTGTNYGSVAGGGNENLVRSNSAPNDYFSEDMVGMLWQWGTGAPAAFVGKTYRITAVATQTGSGYQEIRVVDPTDGSAPDFHGGGPIVDQPGGVFIGVELVPSPGYATSLSPDETTNSFFVNGHPLALDPTSGVARAQMRVDSPAMTVANGEVDPDIFEEGSSGGGGPTFDGLIGLETPAGDVFTATKPGQLQVDTGGFCFWSSGTRQYGGATQASATPNEALAVTKSAESSANASDGTWGSLESVVLAMGTRKMRVAFYDPLQGVVSNPGPDVEFTPPKDSGTDPAGYLGIIVSDLPIAREPGDIERWIYMTASGGEGNYFRVARIQDNISTSISISKYEQQLRRGIVLEFDNQAPPRCLVVEAHEGVMAYGNLKRLVSSDQGLPVDVPDGVVFSKSARPFEIPYTNFMQLASGQGDEVRGMRDLNGVLIIGKKQSTFRAILRQFSPQFEHISRLTGVLSHQSMVVIGNRMYVYGDRGVYVYPAGGTLTWVSENLQTFFTEDQIEAGWGKWVTAALNPLRSQYVMAVRKVGQYMTTHRVSTEFDDEYSGAALQKLLAAHRWSHYEGFPISTLAAVQDPSGRVQRMMAGTIFGHLVWMDDLRANLNQLGPTQNLWGSASLVADPGSLGDEIKVSDVGVMDTDLDGMRGLVARWGADDLNEGLVLLANGTSPRSIFLERDVGSANVPASGDTIRVGNPQTYWESRWMDFGDSWANKKGLYLDLVFSPESAGTVTVVGYEDGDMSAERAIGTVLLDGSGDVGFIQVSLPCPLFGKHLKIRVESYDQFEITEMVWRLDDVEQD